MFSKSIFAFSLALAAIAGILSSGGQGAMADQPVSQLEIGQSMPQFELKDFRGKLFSSEDFESHKALAVVFMGVECPLVKHYALRLRDMKEKFGDDLQIIGINSNRHDSVTEMQQFAKETGFKLPMLKDPANRVADEFGAQRTPDVYLFDAEGKLRYRGAIDDKFTYGQVRHKAKNLYLMDAVKAVVSKQQPPVETTESVGCIIGRVVDPNPNSSVTYANQISRILNDRCVNCHRSGEIAPFSLTDYDEVVGWAEMIDEVVAERRMPPWHANPNHGKFKNDPSLTNDELELIKTWVKNGAPFGEKKDLPEPPKYVEGWQIGEPDAEFPIIHPSKPPYPVPAEGVLEYEYFEVKTKFTEDKWIQAAECRIDNRAVVHHIIVAVKGDKSKPGKFDELNDEWITATAPGAPPLILPEGYAKFVPAGATLVFQMHYTPNGTPQTDRSSVGFKFADPKTVKKVVGTEQVINTEFEIPAGAKKHKVTAPRDRSYRFRRDTLVLSMFPHMHLRGKSFRYTIKKPGEAEEIVLDVPEYDFNWQNGYHFEEPLLMPAGTELRCIAHFDNSEDNFANPKPDEPVFWGDQTDEEMMIGYFDMTLADQDLTKQGASPRTQALLERIEAGKEIVTADIRKSAKTSLSSRKAMQTFGATLQPAFPNIDRACLTTFSGDTLRVDRVVQVSQFRKKTSGEGESVAAKGTKLFEIQQQGKPVALANLKAIKTTDMQYMSVAARSSFHVPVKIGDKSGTFNFWSSEADAFPEPVQALLVELVNESIVGSE